MVMQSLWLTMKQVKVHTAHTTNLVPLILMSDTLKSATLESGKLCDIAPTLLDFSWHRSTKIYDRSQFGKKHNVEILAFTIFIVN